MITKIVHKIDGNIVREITEAPFDNLVDGVPVSSLSVGDHIITVELYEDGVLSDTISKTITITNNTPYNFPTDSLVFEFLYNEARGNCIDNVGGLEGAVQADTGDRDGNSITHYGTPNGFITIPDNPVFEFGSGDFTVLHQFTFNEISDAWLVSKRNSTTSIREWQLTYYQGALEFTCFDDANSGNVRSSITKALQTGVKYTAIATRRGSVTKLYLNTETLDTAVQEVTGTYVGMQNTGAAFTVGKAQFSDGFEFSGKSHRTRIHKGYGFTETEIQNYFNYLNGV